MKRRDMPAPLEIERYLLGRLTGSERAEVEARLFEQDSVLESVLDAEDELIDRYLSRELGAADRNAFERHFAASPLRRQRIALARALSRSAEATRVYDAVPSPTRPVPWWVRLPAKAWPDGVAVAAGLAALSVIWLELAPHVGEVPPTSGLHRAAGPSGPPAASPEAASDAESRRPLGQATPGLDPTPSLVLRGGLQRGSGPIPRLRVPPSADEVWIRAEGAFVAAGRYRARLRRVEGDAVWSGWAVPSRTGGAVSVRLPARTLAPDDYVLSVSPAGGADEDAAEYPLRVVHH
ncbi:MAG: hypothetical protein DMF78_02440 [Acidobacteria bacterium]|nr:MAG: hypothetical protein DMF78_02440 [Acidobacteriota bacterium]